MEIGAGSNSAALAQSSNEVRQTQAAPPPRESAELQNSESQSTTQSASSAPDPNQRVGGRVDTFA